MTTRVLAPRTFLENRALRRAAYKQAVKDLKPLARANAANYLKAQRDEMLQALAVRQAILRGNKAKSFMEAVSD